MLREGCLLPGVLPADGPFHPCYFLHLFQVVTTALETQNVVATCSGSELIKNMLPHLNEQLEL